MKYKRKKNYWQRAIRKTEYIKALLQGSFIISIISYLFYGKWLYAILLSPYLIRYIKSFERQTIKQRKDIFRLQFKEAIQSLSAGLNVGYSVENALREALKDLKNLYKKDDVIVRELAYMIRQLQMNITAETAFLEFAIRTGDEDVLTFVTAFNMAKRSGGDSLEIVRNIVKQMGEKLDVEREIETLLSAKKLELRIMTIIPLAIISYMKFSFPEFFEVLYGNAIGIVVMTICLLIYVIAFEMGKRMVEIEV